MRWSSNEVIFTLILFFPDVISFITFVFWRIYQHPQLFFSLAFCTRLTCRSPSEVALRITSSAYRRLLINLPPIWNPSSASLMTISAYRLNKQGASMHHCLTPVATLNQSAVPATVLTTDCCFTYSFCIRSITCKGKPILVQSWLCEIVSNAFL